MSIYCAQGSPESALSSSDLKRLLSEALGKLGGRDRVLAVAPDQTRIHSHAGELTRYVWQFYGERLRAVLIALGTHTPMTADQLTRMYGEFRCLCSMHTTGAMMWKPSEKSPLSSLASSPKAN